MLAFCNFAGNEDAEMADALVQKAHDDLPARLDLVSRAVRVEHPIECLLRRSDVVAHGGEENDWSLYIAQIEGWTPGGILAGPEPVANEEILHDPFNLFLVHEGIPAPPAFEVKEAVRLGID